MTPTTAESPRPRWAIIIATTVLHLLTLLALLPSNFSWAAFGVAVLLYCLTMAWIIRFGIPLTDCALGQGRQYH